MKIVCEKSNLVSGLSIVSKAVPNKTTMSILECILIDTRAGSIKLIANNTELGIETYIEGDVVEKGMVALDAKIFFDIVRKLPDNMVTIETDSSMKTTITCETTKFNLLGKSGEDFSFLPEIERGESVIISQFTLKEIVRQTIFAISENDNNRIMSGELLEIKENTLRLVALDGHRISIRKVALKNNYPAKKVIVPGKTLNEVSKIISGGTDQDVSLYFTNNFVVFEFDSTVVVSRLIEGEYFNVDQMITKDYETKVTINKKILLDCFDRSTLLVKEGDKKPVILDIKDADVELKINSAIGSMNEHIEIEKTGKDIMIGFNPKFVMDALRAIDDETVDIYMVNPKAPCFIRDENESYIYLVLPVNFTTVS